MSKEEVSIVLKMDSLPPNDPNRNQPGAPAKDVPHDGSPRNRRGVNARGEMEVFGDMSDGNVVVVMFLVGVASWFLRERCVC
ncbi:expressed unknown protein [Seminavis robusta]|uniref:Uncharacterized protein n=1 Tax=Seminavis robusta TaxID=568900 RepID=A0A9N8EBB2_9STRA|nr:expressed unknown protein [Seminavis robusta]|eukprot:Sro702_g189960.1 n/a (82) ;mRNA; r:28977-29965